MAEIIKDGTGKGAFAKVSTSNRLLTDASIETRAAVAARAGDAYNINTSTINLSGTASSALLYFQNTGENDVIITAFFYLLGNSDGRRQ